MNLDSLHPHAALHQGATTPRRPIARVSLTPFRAVGGVMRPSPRCAELPSPPASHPPLPEVIPPAPPRPDVQPPEITDPPPSDVPLPVREPPGMPPPMATVA